MTLTHLFFCCFQRLNKAKCLYSQSASIHGITALFCKCLFWKTGAGVHETSTVPAVIEGGSGRREGQTLTELVPLAGHMSQLEQDRLHLLVHLVAVHLDGRGGGGLTGRTCVSQHVTGGMCRSQSSDDGGISAAPPISLKFQFL